ncbi:hypothetical protein CBW65_05885 [Tumebacillus avium]|uniref:Uncharacterized protein n=1 Tax=Tumebacillus avium TaxID=1903704 RepID=A0A1Y0IM79_9BACL|nr:hypothetical protein CBW65_05885 [Tumebacillus avium]
MQIYLSVLFELHTDQQQIYASVLFELHTDQQQIYASVLFELHTDQQQLDTIISRQGNFHKHKYLETASLVMHLVLR